MKKRVFSFFLAVVFISFSVYLSSCNVPNNNTTQPGPLPTITFTPTP